MGSILGPTGFCIFCIFFSYPELRNEKAYCGDNIFFFFLMETSEPEVEIIEVVLMHSRTSAWRHCLLVKVHFQIQEYASFGALEVREMKVGFGFLEGILEGHAWVWGAFSGGPVLRTALGDRECWADLSSQPERCKSKWCNSTNVSCTSLVSDQLAFLWRLQIGKRVRRVFCTWEPFSWRTCIPLTLVRTKMFSIHHTAHYNYHHLLPQKKTKINKNLICDGVPLNGHQNLLFSSWKQVAYKLNGWLVNTFWNLFQLTFS